MFRSETMQHGTLILPADRAHHFIELLGSKTHIQFIDMNAHSLKRQYKRYVQRIDEMERILRYLYSEIDKLPGTHIIPANVENFISMEHHYELDQVEDALTKLYKQFQRFQENNSDLFLQKNQSVEERAVTRIALNSFQTAPTKGSSSITSLLQHTQTFVSHDSKNLLDEYLVPDTQEESLLGFINIAGVILSSEQDRFARAVFRATRGNAFTFFESINEELIDPKTNKPVPRSIFVVYFQSSLGETALKAKIKRLCQAYDVHEHVWPKSANEAQFRLKKLEELITEKSQALSGYEKYFLNEISSLLEVHSESGGSLIEDYRLFCLKEKDIYATLNFFEGEEITLRADCWLPKQEEDIIRKLLMQTMLPNQASAFLLQDKSVPKDSPPTYIRTTKFTAIFQAFVDTYGVPRYKEVNPALLTIITFPFLFGIMYGDIGHAACLFAFGLYLVFFWDSLKNSNQEIVLMLGGGRYMILLMSLFAIFSGLLYNDFFSLGLDLFGTRYEVSHTEGDQIHYRFDKNRSAYPFGFDPIWKGATNELLFTNSFKMKFAIVVGFAQMVTGICLKGMNTLFFKDRLSFFFEFIPQLIFMVALVGFMVLLIFWKWIAPIGLINGKSNKPLIITSVIEMCMLQTPSFSAFSQQATVQQICFILMVISIPWMLLPKPLILRWMHSKKQKQLQLEKKNQDYEAQSVLEEIEPKFDFGEEMIHQIIETIEFVLGGISNTASYLRLWALSLAHQQLSSVFFDIFIKTILKMNINIILNGILLFFVFGAFAGFTFGVLLWMDTLECFLHALRLQWVEFQNKFYKADGYAFQPFSFKNTLTASNQ